MCFVLIDTQQMNEVREGIIRQVVPNETYSADRLCGPTARPFEEKIALP